MNMCSLVEELVRENQPYPLSYPLLRLRGKCRQRREMGRPSPAVGPRQRCGEVAKGHVEVPIPVGVSIGSSLVPQPGNLQDHLGFPIVVFASLPDCKFSEA